MPSVADKLRAETRRQVGRLSPGERIALALQLGDADVALFSQARGLDPVDARRLMARQRQAGRTFCSCMRSDPR